MGVRKEKLKNCNGKIYKCREGRNEFKRVRDWRMVLWGKDKERDNRSGKKYEKWGGGEGYWEDWKKIKKI